MRGDTRSDAQCDDMSLLRTERADQRREVLYVLVERVRRARVRPWIRAVVTPAVRDEAEVARKALRELVPDAQIRGYAVQEDDGLTLALLAIGELCTIDLDVPNGRSVRCWRSDTGTGASERGDRCNHGLVRDRSDAGVHR